jgi:hypothetical protein
LGGFDFDAISMKIFKKERKKEEKQQGKQYENTVLSAFFKQTIFGLSTKKMYSFAAI